ncbi:MAG: hypothetical protein MUE52_10980 [Tabrizicola sp.]|nr:hypothetical protein [Tabrizicola sp.]
MTRHDPIDTGPRADPRAPDVIRFRQAARAAFRQVRGEQALIVRVEAGRKVVRGAMVAEVPSGALVLMPAGLALDVENHPATNGPYRATGILLTPGIAAPTGGALVARQPWPAPAATRAAVAGGQAARLGSRGSVARLVGGRSCRAAWPQRSNPAPPSCGGRHGSSPIFG